jgi:hypothetical protein
VRLEFGSWDLVLAVLAPFIESKEDRNVLDGPRGPETLFAKFEEPNPKDQISPKPFWNLVLGSWDFAFGRGTGPKPCRRIGLVLDWPPR